MHLCTRSFCSSSIFWTYIFGLFSSREKAQKSLNCPGQRTARERGTHLAVELLGVLLPLVLVEEVGLLLAAAAATVSRYAARHDALEEADVAPVLERIGAVLLLGLAGEGDALLDEAAEGRDAGAGPDHDDGDLGRRRQAEVGATDVDRHREARLLAELAARSLEPVLGRALGPRVLLDAAAVAVLVDCAKSANARNGSDLLFRFNRWFVATP